jgi:hypothetical protein
VIGRDAEESPMLPSALRRALILAAAGALVAAAPASARLYVSTYTAAASDGTVQRSIDAYGYGDAGQETHTYRVELLRGGAVVAADAEQYYASLPDLPFGAGDQIRVTDVDTGLAKTTTVSGRPALDAGVCGTPSTFSGLRDAGATLHLSATLDDGGSARTNVNRVRLQTFFGTGDTFSGSFKTTLSPSWMTWLSQSRAIDAGFTVFTDVGRPVGTCPPAQAISAPGAPAALAPAPAPKPPAIPIKDTILPFAKLTPPASVGRPSAAYRALVAGTFTDKLLVSEPGTVTQTVYLDDGATLPKATPAAARKKAARKPTVVAQGSVTVRKPSVVTVRIKVSKKGKARLRRARTTKLVLVTVLKDKAGNVRVLPLTRFTVKRVKGAK